MIKNWTQVTLGEIATLKQGFALNKKSDHYISKEPTQFPLLKISDLFNNTETLFVKQTIPKQFLVGPSEIIYSRTGQVGYAFTGKSGVVYNNCFKVIPNEKVDSIFLFHILNSQPVRQLAKVLATGTAQPDLNHGAFKSIKILIPPLPTQHKIASILTAYDDLIENNLKRIKLLEEKAQLMYEEWFVRLRFPGHEEVKIDEETGLPEGWERIKLIDCCILTMGQSPKSIYYNEERKGLPFHQGVKDYSFRFPTNSTWSTEGNRLAKENSILFSVRAPVGRLNVAMEDLILGRGLAAINHKAGYNSFLYYQLQNIFYKDNLMGGGAIFNSVTKKDVEGIKLIHAPNKIEERYESTVSKIDLIIKKLTQENTILKEARDILLPRLMTGMIDVEKMKVPALS